jgi:hypothetical protein
MWKPVGRYVFLFRFFQPAAAKSKVYRLHSAKIDPGIFTTPNRPEMAPTLYLFSVPVSGLKTRRAWRWSMV